MLRIRRSIRLGKPLTRSSNLPAKWRTNPLSKQSLRHALHVMGPTLTALLLAGVGSGVAHAQGTMDFSGAQTLMSTFKTFAMYAGAVIHLAIRAALRIAEDEIVRPCLLPLFPLAQTFHQPRGRGTVRSSQFFGVKPHFALAVTRAR